MTECARVYHARNVWALRLQAERTEYDGGFFLGQHYTQTELHGVLQGASRGLSMRP